MLFQEALPKVQLYEQQPSIKSSCSDSENHTRDPMTFPKSILHNSTVAFWALEVKPLPKKTKEKDISFWPAESA
jgi:hypothetical protein